MIHELKNDLQEVFVQVEHLEDKNVIKVTWISDHLLVEEVKAGCLLILDKMAEHKIPLFLNDGSRVSSSWDEANDWIANEWMPKASALGLKKMAHILSKDIFAQLSAEFMEENNKAVSDAFQLRLFNTKEDAQKWLFE